MKLFSFWRLFTTDAIKPGHRKYITWAIGVMSLEYLDIIVYIHNANGLADLYLKTQFDKFLGLGILLLILWLSNFTSKFLANYLFEKFVKIFYNRFGLAFFSIFIAFSLVLQAWVILTFCPKTFFLGLSMFFVGRLLYQTAINIVMRDTYEAILSMDDLYTEFVALIVNSLEISLLIGVVGYKIIAETTYTGIDSLMIFVFVLAAFWLFMGILVLIYNLKNSKPTSESKLPISFNNVKTIYSDYPKDSLIAVGLVGIRSSLSILGVICMPFYLVQNLHLVPHAASNIISISSMLALLLNIWINQHLHKFDFTIIVKFGLSGLIIGSLISYMLFFYQVIPIVAVTILMVFHGFFAVACPMILNKLFNPRINPLAVISCYRNSFFLFSTITFLILIFFTQVLNNYFFPPEIFLIMITGICYLCILLFNRQLPKNK